MSNDVTHLYHLSYHLRTDLAAEALTLAPQSPTTNEATAVTCRVRNAGDLTVSGAQVSFYLGDPSVGGVLIGAAAVSPNVLRAGAEGTASLSWTTPADAQPAELVAIVDADGAVVEEDEANNATSMWLFLPDLRVDSVRYEERASGEVDLIARVFNAGTLAAPPFQVGFSADGYDIGSEEMPGLLPGTAYDVARLAWAQVTFTNRPARVVAAVDPLDAIAEGNESNNTDYVEVLLESDCDGDQMADQWEKCFFFDLSRDETSDSDGDGASDQHECWAGTDPTDSGSVFRCAIGPHDEQGRIQLAWQVVPGQTYQLQRCDDLRLGEWQDVGEPVTVDSGVLQQSFLDEPPAGVRQRYYRVRLVTAP